MRPLSQRQGNPPQKQWKINVMCNLSYARWIVSQLSQVYQPTWLFTAMIAAVRKVHALETIGTWLLEEDVAHENDYSPSPRWNALLNSVF